MRPELSCSVPKLALPITRLSISRPATATFTACGSSSSFGWAPCLRSRSAAWCVGLKSFGKATPCWRIAASFSRRSAISGVSSFIRGRAPKGLAAGKATILAFDSLRSPDGSPAEFSLLTGRPGLRRNRTVIFRPDIEGLRAVSVILVVAYHYFPAAVPGGYIGVDVFFVISGYLITQSLVEHSAKSLALGPWLLDFWARRARRLLPNALLVMVAASAVGLVALSDFSIKRLGSDVFWSATYSVNWLF